MTMDKLLQYLEDLESNAIKQQDEIAEPFNNLDEQNAWYYSDGYIDAIRSVKDFIKG